MNHFERVAIFTTIENIEAQLKGLKTLIAASANQAAPTAQTHRVTSTIESDSTELSESDEEELEKQIKLAQAKEIERMRLQAETAFQKEWAVTQSKMSELDG